MPTNTYPPCFYRVSTKALIYKYNKVLLVKEADGRWELPGGGLEADESFVEGIKRELIEEIGVNATKISSQPVYIWKLLENGVKPKLMLAFEVEVDSYDFKGNEEESAEFGFFSRKEMESMNLHPNITQLPKVMK